MQERWLSSVMLAMRKYHAFWLLYHKWFVSCNYCTGKVLRYNTLDLTDIFCDAQRPMGITHQPWCQHSVRLGLKNVHLNTKWAGSAALCSLPLACPSGSDSFRHTWEFSPPNTISHEIEGKWTRKKKLSLLSFSLGSLPSFLSVWNLYVGICRIGLDCFWTHICSLFSP